MIYNQSNFYPFKEIIEIGQFSVSQILLVTINRLTSDDSSFLRRIRRGFIGHYQFKPRMTPVSFVKNHTRFADWVTIWVVHLPERTETGWPYKNSAEGYGAPGRTMCQ